MKRYSVDDLKLLQGKLGSLTSIRLFRFLEGGDLEHLAEHILKGGKILYRGTVYDPTQLTFYAFGECYTIPQETKREYFIGSHRIKSPPIERLDLIDPDKNYWYCGLISKCSTCISGEFLNDTSFSQVKYFESPEALKIYWDIIDSQEVIGYREVPNG